VERTNSRIFLILLNSALATLKLLIKMLLREKEHTDGQTDTKLYNSLRHDNEHNNISFHRVVHCLLQYNPSFAPPPYLKALSK